jgi:MoaA/NifB/PqqE/SkfB family radical SAM enzyme
MLAELHKALTVSQHPGMDKHLNLPRLMWQGLPFLTSQKGYARPPLTLYWSVNSVCNLHCKMCDVGTPNPDSNFFKNLRINGQRTDIDIGRFKAVIDEVAASKPMISITSTEPLLYKPLGDAIRHCRERNLDIAITTGAYTLAKRAEELVEAGLTRLNVSIDGPPALHNEIRGRKDSFERSAEGIRLVKEEARKRNSSIEVLINFTITNSNYDQLVAFMDCLGDLPVDRVNFSYMNYVTRDMAGVHNAIWGDRYKATVNCLNEETSPDRVKVDVLCAQLAELKARGDKRVAVLPELSREELEIFHYQPQRFLSSQRCMVSWFIGQIIANGDVIPYTRCYYIPFGNINEQPFMEIWNGEKMRAWRQDLRKHKRFPACTRCDQCF